MQKSLDIDTYANGYHFTQLSCFDIVTAVAASAYHYDNYYYFCYLDCVFNNWSDKIGYHTDFTDEILEILGLEKVKHNNITINNFIPFLQDNIDKGIPTVIRIKYNTLFYSPRYLNQEDNMYHSIVISDYDLDKHTITIRDDEQLYTSFNKKLVMSAQGAFKFQITEDMLKNIWLLNQNNDKKEIYTIRQIRGNKIESYLDLFEYTFHSISPLNNRLVDLLLKSIEDPQLNIKDLMDLVKINFYKSFFIVFQTIEKTFNIGKDDIYFNNYFEFKKLFLDSKKFIITKISLEILRNQQEGIKLSKELVIEIISWDKKLFEWMRNLYKNKQKNVENKNKFINLSKGATIIASSEYYSKEYNVLYKASNVNSGKWADIRRDAWISKDMQTENWIMLDFNEIKNIHKFIIRHIGYEGKNTVDFIIQGKKSIQKEWTEIVQVVNNTYDITQHVVENCYFQYIRIYIITPSQVDDIARIYEVEVWGEQM